MNYLAHLHLANLTDTSLLGAFLGDFVKGKGYQAWPENVAQGIILHRKIDTYTDAHPENQVMRSHFPKHLRRMAGVVMDIYYDHLLAKQLVADRHTDTNFLDTFYDALATTTIEDHRHFQRLRHSLLNERWLLNYQHERTYSMAFSAIEKRLQGRIKFASDAELFVVQYKAHFHQAFNRFYPDLMSFAHTCAAELKTSGKLPH
ncbi:MAG: ACP phosphodiesterase [Aestuariibacter sp.]